MSAQFTNTSCFNLNLDSPSGYCAFFVFSISGSFFLGTMWSVIFSAFLSAELYVFFTFLRFMLIKLKLLQRKHLPSYICTEAEIFVTLKLFLGLFISLHSQGGIHIHEQLESWKNQL